MKAHKSGRIEWSTHSIDLQRFTQPIKPQPQWKRNLQRRKLDWVAKRLGIQTQEDWYSVTIRSIRSSGGDSVLFEHNNSILNTLRSVYPEFEWNPLMFQKRGKDVWKHSGLRRQALDTIAQKLQIETQEDWYSVQFSDVRSFGIQTLIKDYDYSISRMLQSIYPEFEWNPSLFQVVPNNYWKEVANQRKVFDNAAEQLGIETQLDWYKVSRGDLVNTPLPSIIFDYYNNSLSSALQTIYQEFEWKLDSFRFVPKRHWQSISNQRKLMDRVAEELGVQTQADWYNISGVDVKQVGAHSLITNYYGNSLFSALQHIYSEFEWNPLLHSSSSRRFVDKIGINTVKQVMDDITGSLYTDDFQRDQIFARVARKFGGKLNALRTFYPDTSWARSNSEILLDKMLRRLTVVEREKRINGHSLDFFLPQYSLAIEIQGAQHYHHHYRGSFSEQQERDMRKRRELSAIGINIVDVPYWWRGSIDSLAKSIAKHNPYAAAQLFGQKLIGGNSLSVLT